MDKQTNTDEPFALSLEQSAAKIGMSVAWLKKQTDIPYVRVGRRKMFRPQDLRAFIDKSVRGTQK
jgi:hypothetical protein